MSVTGPSKPALPPEQTVSTDATDFIGITSLVMVSLYLMVFKGKDPGFAFSVGICIALSLVVSMMIASALGTLIPLFFKKIKVDPAVASGPLITTVNDLVAVACYYGLSWLLLISILHFA